MSFHLSESNKIQSLQMHHHCYSYTVLQASWLFLECWKIWRMLDELSLIDSAVTTSHLPHLH